MGAGEPRRFPPEWEAEAGLSLLGKNPLHWGISVLGCLGWVCSEDRGGKKKDFSKENN